MAKPIYLENNIKILWINEFPKFWSLIIPYLYNAAYAIARMAGALIDRKRINCTKILSALIVFKYNSNYPYQLAILTLEPAEILLSAKV